CPCWHRTACTMLPACPGCSTSSARVTVESGESASGGGVHAEVADAVGCSASGPSAPIPRPPETTPGGGGRYGWLASANGPGGLTAASHDIEADSGSVGGGGCSARCGGGCVGAARGGGAGGGRGALRAPRP